MKTAPKFYTRNEDTVDAYQPADIDKLTSILKFSEKLWHDKWVEQGSKDEGSCTGGKGIQVWFCGRNKRTAELKTVVRCPTGQGNLSAEASVMSALDYLKAEGMEVRYYDGWLD